METISALKQAEGRLMLISDKVTTLGAKLEELCFRAQRIATCKKNNTKSTDSMFSYDLQVFRRELRSFSHEVATLPATIGGIERAATFDEGAVKFASSVWRCADRVSKGLASLHNQACFAHSHIRESDARVEAWFVVQEIEQMAEKGKMLPNAANKILIRVSTPDAPPTPPTQPAVS